MDFPFLPALRHRLEPIHDILEMGIRTIETRYNQNRIMKKIVL